MTASYKSMKNYYTYNNQMAASNQQQHQNQNSNTHRNYMTRSTNTNYNQYHNNVGGQKKSNFKNVANSRLQEMRNFQLKLNEVEEKIDERLIGKSEIAMDEEEEEALFDRKIKGVKKGLGNIFMSLHTMLD